MSRDARKNAHIAHALYGAIIAGKYDVGAVSRRSGIPTACLYDAAENRRDLPARWLQPLYCATHDVALYAQLAGIADAGLVLSERPIETITDESIAMGGLRVGADAGRVQLAVVDAMADGVVDGAERKHIENQIDQLERQAARLRNLLKAKAG